MAQYPELSAQAGAKPEIKSSRRHDAPRALRYSLVAAAGKAGSDNDSRPLPVELRPANVISVAASTARQRRLFKFRTGKTVHVAAPEGILSPGGRQHVKPPAHGWKRNTYRPSRH